MRKFEKPEMEVVIFKDADVIAASVCVASYSYGFDECTTGRAPELVNN